MTTDRAKVSDLAGTIAGMIVAIFLFAVIGVLQSIDDTDAQKLSQMIAERK